MTPRPWHAQARRMRARKTPATLQQIANACGVSAESVRLALNPEARERHHRRNVERIRERLKTDPEYKARHNAWQRKANKRARIRRNARDEAAETGRPVEEVYAQWGVS